MKNTKISQMTMSAVLAALLCVCAVIVVPLGPVPFSLAVFGVCFVGAMQTPAWAAASVGVYILLGAAGLPVFAGFKAGPQVLAGPTGGYLAGYFLLAAFVSAGTRIGQKRAASFLFAALGLLALHLCGAAWFMISTGSSFAAALFTCTLPFILPDAAKCTAALLLAAALRRRMKQENA